MAPAKRYFEAGAEEAEAAAAGGSSSNDNHRSASTGANPSAETASRKPFVSKRFRQQAGPPRPQTTLFVSSLPFTATSTDLTTLFSDIGPLRRAFVVTDKDSGKSKGVGYITYAVHEDAQRAVEEMQGRSLDGGKRKMRIEWATRPGESSADGEAAGTAAATSTPLPSTSPAAATVNVHTSAQDKDPDAVRTVILVGLAACAPAADSKSLYKRTRKIGDVEKVVYPAPASIATQEPSSDVAHVVYRTPNHAMTAVTKLHAHTFKGAQLSVVLKKRADGVARLEAHMRPETRAKRDEVRKRLEKEAEQVQSTRLVTSAAAARQQDEKAGGQHVSQAPRVVADVNRGSRLIVRNLPFDVTDRDLRAVFLPYGPIYSVDVPQKQTLAERKKKEAEAEGDATAADTANGGDAEENDTTAGSPGKVLVPTDLQTADTVASKQGRGRGFAFVWLVSRADASNAIQGVNGKEIQHGASERAQLKSAKGKAGRELAKKALEEVTARAQPARQVAVDWALSKRDFEQRKDESEAEEIGAEESGDGESESEPDPSEEGDGDSDSDMDPVEVDSDEEEEEEEEDEDEESDDEETTKPALPAPEEGTTLFIRNLPYQATEEELRNLFRSFGPLRYAKVTMDKATKRPKGTAFVCFWQKDSADKAIQQARLVEAESGVPSATGSGAAGKRNPFSASSVLTADPSAPLTSTLNLHGRVLSIVPAVARNEAEGLANASQAARDKHDKRNTYLLREGVPLPGTPLSTRLNERELERRLANFQVRKAQMTKNPSLFMSKTRLSVRQLPLFVTPKTLKRLAAHAVKAFDEEVQRGAREALTEDELRASRQLAVDAAKAAEDEDTDGEDDNDGAELSKKQMLRKKRKDALQRRRTSNKGGLIVVQSKVVQQKDRLDAVTGAGRSRGYGFLEMATFADALKVVRWANANGALRKLLLRWYTDELASIAKALKSAVSSSAGASDNKDSRKGGGASDAARLKRVEQKHAQLESGHVDPEEEGTRGGLLVVEFSVENIVVVKRRAERGEVIAKRKSRKEAAVAAEAAGGGAGGSSYNSDGKRKRNDSRGGGPAERAPKKARPATWNQKTPRSKATGAASAGGANALPLGAKNATGKGAPPSSSSTTAPKQGSVMGSVIGRKRKQRKGKA